jgi:protein transport protein SEC24
MAAPQGGYPPQEGYGQPVYGTPEPTQSPVPGQGAPPPAAGGKKKRAYAGEAFDFGSGANAALGGQQTAGGAYGAYPQQPQAAGYQQPVYGADPSQIQAAAPAYGQPAVPDVSQMTQQFGAMGMTEPHHMPPPQPAQAPMRPQVQLNQLYPTDLRSQPFNVAELDYPPPPIILPPGVCNVPCANSQDADC